MRVREGALRKPFGLPVGRVTQSVQKASRSGVCTALLGIKLSAKSGGNDLVKIGLLDGEYSVTGAFSLGLHSALYNPPSGAVMSISTFDLFKVGIGPSSSHTVGPMHAARLFALSLEHEQLLSHCHRLTAELFRFSGRDGRGPRLAQGNHSGARG